MYSTQTNQNINQASLGPAGKFASLGNRDNINEIAVAAIGKTNFSYGFPAAGGGGGRWL